MFRKHKYQWLISALVLLVAFAIGSAIYSTAKTMQNKSSISESIIKSHYQDWQKDYLRGTKRAKFVKTNSTGRLQTLSEAQGYGMLITVMAAQQGFGSQKTFDQLTNYYLDHRISSDNALMAWRQQKNGTKMTSTKAEKTSATDGDLDIAYALILADEHWGSKGTNNYQQIANQLLSSIKSKEINQTTNLPKVGDWATGTTTADLVRTSDLMTAYFRKFASYTKDGSWTKVASNSQSTLRELSAKESTGLMADFVTVSGSKMEIGSVKPNQVASEHDNQYGYNACRIPWRVAYDYQISHSQSSKKVVQKMNRFFTTKKKITAIYTLQGKAVESYTNTAFTAPIAYSAQVLSNQTLQSRYNKVLTAKLSANDYYPATIQMATLLASGSLGKLTK